MRNSGRVRTAALAAALLLFSGCGDALYEMTEEEEAMIVNYAAQTVAKFNSFQPDGEVFVRTDILENGGQEEPGEEEQETETEEPGDEGGSGEAPQPADTPAETPSQPEDTGVTMSAALELGAVSAEYQGYELCGSYQEEDYYALDAEPEKQFLVVKYHLVNASEEAAHVDILGKAPVFSALVNGELKVPAQTTILLNDLSTFQGDVEAKGTKEAVLLFQVPKDLAEISGLQLNVTMNGNDFKINL